MFRQNRHTDHKQNDCVAPVPRRRGKGDRHAQPAEQRRERRERGVQAPGALRDAVQYSRVQLRQRHRRRRF